MSQSVNTCVVSPRWKYVYMFSCFFYEIHAFCTDWHQCPVRMHRDVSLRRKIDFYNCMVYTNKTCSITISHRFSVLRLPMCSWNTVLILRIRYVSLCIHFSPLYVQTDTPCHTLSHRKWRSYDFCFFSKLHALTILLTGVMGYHHC